MGNAVEKIGRAIERIDDEARLGGIAFDLSAFFQQETPIGPRPVSSSYSVRSAA